MSTAPSIESGSVNAISSSLRFAGKFDLTFIDEDNISFPVAAALRGYVSAFTAATESCGYGASLPSGIS
jgi:hypothetical protein